MGHPTNRAALQLLGFVLGTVGWLGAAVAAGLVQWRVWRVSSAEVTSGVAWVGIWRVCFYSRALTAPPFRRMWCQRLGATDGFVPPEIAVAQGLLLAAVLSGALGKAANVSGLREAYLGGERRPRRAWLAFAVGGGFHLLAGVCVAVPAAWNLRSVVSNQAIPFPPRFRLPGRPQSQELGAAVYVAIFSAALLVLAGAFLASYRPSAAGPRVATVHPSAEENLDSSGLVSAGPPAKSISLSSCGADNPALPFRGEPSRI